MDLEEILISNSSWSSFFEEFFVIGINSVEQAKSLIILLTYKFL